MENSQVESKDNFVLTFKDMASIARKNRKTIWVFTALCAFFALFYALTRPPEYQVEATFKDKGKSQSGINQSLTAILLSGEISDSNVLAMMKSRRLVEHLVRSLGLQAVIAKNEPSFPILPLKTMRENFLAEYASLVNLSAPVLGRNGNVLMAEKVVYHGEVPLELKILFIAQGQFEISGRRGESIGRGSLGIPFISDVFEITLRANSQQPDEGVQYNLTLNPLEKTAEKIAKKFKIETDRNDKNLLKITYRNHDRYHAVSHINALMAAYQDYITEEHHRINNVQIDYLQERQHEMSRQLEEMINNYARNLSSNLSSIGVATYDKAMDFLTVNQQNFMQKILVIDLEMQWLHQVQDEGRINYDKFNSTITPEAINMLSKEIRFLKQKADTIDLALRNTPLDRQQFQESLIRQLQELNDIKRYSEEAKMMLASLENDKMPEQHEVLFNSQEFMVKIWYERLLNSDRENSKGNEWLNCKSNCISYLSHLIHFLDVRQRSIEERLTDQQLPLGEFQGIDLNTAKQLYVSYSKELKELEASAAQNQFLISQINQPDFEISTLSTVLKDPISTQMISDSSRLILSLRDHENRTQREQERIKSTLSIYKEFFVTHIGQELQLLELRQNILKEKIQALQSTNLALIQERISILENQMAEYISKRLMSLKRERGLYENILEEFKKEMSLLPHKWVTEKLIYQQMEINQNMVEEISRLVESKNITNNLETIQSTPIDLPILPLHPRPPHLILFTMVGAVAGSFLGFAWVLGKSIAKGVEASSDNLRLSGKHVSGLLTQDCTSRPDLPMLDNNLDTLRRLIAFFVTEEQPIRTKSAVPSAPGKTLLLLVGKGPIYAQSLAELMAKRGLKILIINLCFDSKDDHEQESGVLQYLEGIVEEPTIISKRAYDVILMGGITRHATELIATSRFSTMIDKLQTRYDWIIVCSNAGILSAEAESLMNRFYNVAVTIAGEPLSQLDAYMHLPGNMHRITFVMLNPSCYAFV